MVLGRIFNTVDAGGLLFLRLSLGIIFMAHGSQKLFGWFGGGGFAATAQDFQQGLGFAMPLTLLAVIAEFFGGLAVVAGCLTRVAALGLGTVMLVAMTKVHGPQGFFLNWTCAPGAGHGIEFNLALLGMSLTLLFTGPGAFSVDRWLSER